MSGLLAFMQPFLVVTQEFQNEEDGDFCAVLLKQGASLNARILDEDSLLVCSAEELCR